MAVLSRVSCDYDPIEDRIKILAESEDGYARTLWANLRLLGRLLPHLIQWLEQQAGTVESGSNEVLFSNTPKSGSRQKLAQETAAARIKPQEPVQSSNKQPGLLIKEVDIKSGDQGVILVFKHDQGSDSLALRHEQLRQWLLIMYRLWQQSEWQAEFWPDWIAGLGERPEPESTGSWH